MIIILMPHKDNDHLQCGCEKVEQPNLSIHKTENQTIATQCECTIQTKKRFVKKKGKIVKLKFKRIFVGKDTSLK